MAKQYKVRLADGIELGPVDVDTLRSWYEGATIKKDSQVLSVGSKKWTRLMDAVAIGGWQMPSPTLHRAAKAATAGAKHPHAQVHSDPPQRWRTYLAAMLMLLAAGGAGYLAFFPELWVASLRLAPWREIALAFLALGLALVRGWEPMRMLVRALMLLLTFALFPLAGVLWVEGVRGLGLLVLGSAWLLGSGFFALLSRSRQSALVSAACVLLVLAGAAGIGYFGVLMPQQAVAAAAVR